MNINEEKNNNVAKLENLNESNTVIPAPPKPVKQNNLKEIKQINNNKNIKNK